MIFIQLILLKTAKGTILDPYLMIPYKRDMSLTQDLEFKILDANRKHVHISDNSQLFFILTMI